MIYSITLVLILIAADTLIQLYSTSCLHWHVIDNTLSYLIDICLITAVQIYIGFLRATGPSIVLHLTNSKSCDLIAKFDFYGSYCITSQYFYNCGADETGSLEHMSPAVVIRCRGVCTNITCSQLEYLS